MRLSPETCAALPEAVARPGYDRAAQAVGIVHLGIGAFHRAHQAHYTDAAMSAGDRDWMIAGVSLRSPAVAADLNPQRGLFTLTERDAHGGRTRLIGAVREVLVARETGAGARIAALLAAPETAVVTLTVTEKGYGLGADRALDLAAARAAPTLYTLLAEGLAARWAAGCGGLTLVSCDNLADNGTALAGGLSAHLDATDPELARWFAAECACPNTMVDRIVPASTAADRAALAAAIGVEDAGAVFTEPFRQWVIEDRFAARRPRWDAGGAQFVGDVRPYETAKLRMLNGAHSALAYLGLAGGHEFVHQAVADPAIRARIERLMRREAAPSIARAPGQDLDHYADALLARFANPALAHRLAQIAIDGSQKVPQRWLETLAFHTARGAQCPAILAALAAWLRHLRGDNGPVDDPRADELAEAWRSAGKDGIVAALFGPQGLFGAVWQANPASRAVIEAHL